MTGLIRNDDGKMFLLRYKNGLCRCVECGMVIITIKIEDGYCLVPYMFIEYLVERIVCDCESKGR